MVDARPYPYHRWPSVSGEEVERARAWARHGPLAALRRGSARAGSWLGTRPVLRLQAPPRSEPWPLALDPIVAVVLEAPTGARSLLVLDALLAAHLVDRTLGGDGEHLDAIAGPLRELERGILAYAMARWLAGTGSSLRVAAVLTSAAAGELLGPGSPLAWRLELELGRERGALTIWTPPGPAPLELPRSLPTWAAELPVELAVQAGVVELDARTLARLGPGDVVLPDRTTLRRGSAGPEGAVWLEPSGGGSSWRAELCPGGLRITSECEPAPRRRTAQLVTEESVSDAKPLLETLGDTPVTLSLELARFALPLAELATLGPGEVVRTGAAIGERVVLRAGDKTIATGELVEVEGEVGVRILELP